MIGHWSTHQVAQAINASVTGLDTKFTWVMINGRQSCTDSLFVALKGENFDAHDFLGQAVAQGAVALLVDHPVDEQKLVDAQLITADTTIGLGLLGALNRRRFSGKVVAVTGSAGKTTVKELVASILEQSGAVCKTQGNLNNHIGVPLSLLTLQEKHQAAVFELGASGLDEIAYSVGLVQPDVVVLNNAYEAHIEGFGCLQNVVTAKGEIVRDMPEQAIAILNADDRHFEQWLKTAGNRKVMSFGLVESAQVSAKDISLYTSNSHFTLMTPLGSLPVELPFPGEHNVCNALAASAAALAAGVSLQQVVTGLASAAAVPGRLYSKAGMQGSTVIDDTYNASPASMKEALRVLAGYSGRRLAVLGDMAELGKFAGEGHSEVGVLARSLGIDQIWVTGVWAKNYQQGFGAETFVFKDKKRLITELSAQLQTGDIVLVKGSRSAGMEEVVNSLCISKETK